MANRKLANSIARKLKEFDRKIDHEIYQDEYPTEKLIQLEKQKLIKEAHKKLNLVSVGVADGNAVYWESNRTTRLVTFEWLYGGGDQYVDDWGPIVAIPLAHACRMIKNFQID